MYFRFSRIIVVTQGRRGCPREWRAGRQSGWDTPLSLTAHSAPLRHHTSINPHRISSQGDEASMYPNWLVHKMSSWLSSTFSQMLLSAICYYLFIYLGPISMAVARPNLWPAGETLLSSLHVSGQAIEPENISGFENTALERGNVQRYLPGNVPMPQQPNSITMCIDKYDQGKYAHKAIIQSGWLSWFFL